MKKAVEEKSVEMAREMKDDCDGSYVGAECSSTIEFDGQEISISVTAFWEKSNWLAYEAYGDGIHINGDIYDF